MSFKVDIHTHVLLKGTMGGAGEYGPEIVEQPESGDAYFRVGKYKLRTMPGDGYLLDPRYHDPRARLEDMDKRDVDVMGVSASPLTYFYWIEPEIAVQFARLQNDEMEKFCSVNPDRLFFFATLPLQDIDATVAEIERVSKFKSARGLNIGQTDVALGKFPDDPAFWPVYERAQRYSLPLLNHPYPPGIEHGTGEHQLTWIAGYIHQSTMFGASMVLGGVFDEFPKLKLILPHGGGALPYQWGRFAYAGRRMPGAKAKRKIDEYLPNLYFDCLIHNPAGRRFLIDFAGAEHVVVGDNYLGWDAVDGFEMIKELSLPKDAEARIMGLNAAELFRLDVAAARERGLSPA